MNTNIIYAITYIYSKTYTCIYINNIYLQNYEFINGIKNVINQLHST